MLKRLASVAILASLFAHPAIGAMPLGVRLHVSSPNQRAQSLATAYIALLEADENFLVSRVGFPLGFAGDVQGCLEAAGDPATCVRRLDADSEVDPNAPPLTIIALSGNVATNQRWQCVELKSSQPRVAALDIEQAIFGSDAQRARMREMAVRCILGDR